MTSLAELIAQKEALEAQITAARRAEYSEALQQVKSLVAQFGFESQDVFATPGKRGRKPRAEGDQRATVAPKYRDPMTGQTWSGRGKPPKWIQDKDRSQYAI